MKWINYQVPSKAAQVKAMFEIGKAEIAGAVTKVPLFWRAIAKAECKEEFWDLWGKENEETVKNFHIVRVLLIGFTSEEQMKYDENVLNDIMAELGSQPRATKPSDESWIKNADSAGMWLMCGSYVSVDYIIETLSQATQHGGAYADLKKKYTPPLDAGLRRPGLVPELRAGPSGLLRVPDLLGSGRGYERCRPVLPRDVEDEHQEPFLYLASRPSPAALSDRAEVRTQLS